MVLRAMDVLRNGFGGRGLEETHAGLGGAPSLDGAVFLTPQRLYSADAVEVEAGDFCCWSVVLRKVCDGHGFASSRSSVVTAMVI
jgi:hypothetical protein